MPSPAVPAGTCLSPGTGEWGLEIFEKGHWVLVIAKWFDSIIAWCKEYQGIQDASGVRFSRPCQCPKIKEKE